MSEEKLGANWVFKPREVCLAFFGEVLTIIVEVRSGAGVVVAKLDLRPVAVGP